jgi:two-component sensor histidine kinase
MVVSSLYGISFLEIRRFVPGIYKFSTGVFLYFAVYFLCLFLLPRPLMLLLNQVNALLVTFFMFWLGAMAARHGNKLGYYYAAAYLIYFSIVLVEVIYIQTGKPGYLFEVSHVSMATLIESLFLAYLLSMRFNLERREVETEKNRTRERLMHQIQENEDMTKKQNVVLEETVKLRTQEIENQKKIVEKTLAEKELSLKKEELLLKEIHHRIKNNLQTISSILMLQSSTLSDEKARQAITDSRNRVNAIALIHQKLYQVDGIEKIEFNSFVQDIVEEVKEIYNEKSRYISINREIPVTYLPIDIAIPLALIITELFTNSFKYSFNNAIEGSIEMTLTNPDDSALVKGRAVSFKYRDSGPGFYPPLLVETTSTLGLRLISLLSAQIGASVKYDNSNGSEFIFTFSISN